MYFGIFVGGLFVDFTNMLFIFFLLKDIRNLVLIGVLGF